MQQLIVFTRRISTPASNLLTGIIFIGITCLSFNLHAADLIDQSANIFKFQQKLAQNGNVNAQYKLATMYETGEGVSKSIEKAKHWYSRAASAGSAPAEQRGQYLIIKQRGYDQNKDNDWLNGVLTDYKTRKPEAILLLGQMYSEGLGVNKDLDESLRLLRQVGILGTADVDDQIAAIEGKIESLKKSELVARAATLTAVPKKGSNIEALTIPQQQVKTSTTLNEESARLLKAEKRRRYEEVMRKLKLEQEQIDAQQAWSTGDALATADDEI
ncbi:MAG: sel1 repeat family protein [Proteobacteria bacterium]|nr:sel1 repeat family protein [Pseudomonadota bacterium]